MLVSRALRGSGCARCRLRGLILEKEVGRRKAAVSATTMMTSNTSIPQNTRSFSTTFSRPKRDRIRSRKPPRTREPQAAAETESAPISHQQSVQILESLYTGGHITLSEWRSAVDQQLNFVKTRIGETEIQEDGREWEVVREHKSFGKEGRYKEGVEKRVRKIWEFFGGLGVPGVLLEQEERLVGERLFGGCREVEMEDLEEGVEDDLVEEEGTRVLKEDGEGGLEEVEFDDEVEWLDETTDEETIGRIREGQRMDDRNTEEAMEEEEDEERSVERSHPLTAAHRFTTSPATLSVPETAFVAPVTGMLSNIPTVHIAEKASSIFGGPGLPYSTSTPSRLKTMQPKPIALDAFQSQMGEMESDVYMSAIMPGVYSSVMSTLVETRKRMGTAWAERLVEKAEAGELRILDAGGAGAGVLAVRELLRAEWERMHEDSHGDESPLALAELDGKAGGEGANAPTGKATVLVGSKTLERRVSKLFENTTFVPRLPDYVHTEEAKKTGKFDLVIAPHTLWPIREDHMRKAHVQNLWSMLSVDGGVLLMLEKGMPRGFELIAGAREMLLDKHISNPHPSQDTPKDNALHSETTKEPGQIIAPCTNHSSCPMYVPKTSVRGRRDICSFEQRYHRPPFLQRIFGTKGRNHEDVEFSYVSLMRGNPSSHPRAPPQNDSITQATFQGLEGVHPNHVDGRQLPRMVMPPMKRKGHVILDLCTPAGKLERWTVPRSFSKVAYRDARKSSWGDLWALGAKTRIPRNIVIKKHANNSNSNPPEVRDQRVGRSGKAKYLQNEGARFEGGKFDGGMNDRRVFTGQGAPREGLGADAFGRITVDGRTLDGVKGKTRGKKVKGVREKRDKKADGRGRRKDMDE